MRHTLRNHLTQAALLAAGFVLHKSVAHAAIVTWDSNANATDGVTDGTANWTANATNWYNGTTDAAWNSNGLDTAAFGNGASTSQTVTLSTNFTASGLIFNQLSAGAFYTLTSTNRTLALNADSIINVANTGGAVISCKISGAEITKSGAGALTLSKANTLSGIILDAGILKVGIGGAIGASPTLTFSAASTGTLQVNGFTVSLSQLNTNATTLGAPVIENGSTTNAVLTLNTTASNTYAGVMRDGGSGTLALTKSGTGSLTLSGNNTYTGGTTLTAGTISFAAGSLGSTGAISMNGGTLQWNGSNTDDISGRLTMVTGKTATFDTNGNNVTFASAIGGGTTGALTKTGAGTLTLSGNNTYTGGTIISAGTLALSGASSLANTGALTVSGGTFDLGTVSDTVGAVTLTSGTIAGTTGVLTGTSYAIQSGTISAILGGSGALTKSTTGTVMLTGANSYSGTTTISAGVLNVRSDTALGATGAITIASGAALEIQGGITLATQALSLTGTGVASDGALRNVSGDNAFGGAITLGNSPAEHRINSDAGTLTLSGGINETGSAPKTLTFGGAGTTSVSGIISGSTKDLLVAKDGSGTLILSGANTYDDATTISGGTLRVTTLANGGFASGIGSSAVDATNLIINGGTLDYSGTSASSTNRLLQIGSTVDGGMGTISNNAILAANTVSFTAAGAVTYGTTSQTRTITLAGTNAGDNVFALTITNNGASAVSFIKDGVGKWILSATSGMTYSGATTVNAGTLIVSGSIANSAITLNSGATLGLGTTGTTTINAASLTWNGDGVMQFTLGATGVNDKLVLTGALTKGTGGTFTFDFLGSGVENGTYTLITAGSVSGFTTGNFTGSVTNLAAGLYGSIAVNGNQIALTVIPEPWEYALGFAGAAALLAGMKRRKRAAK
jgi:fibronectin-binding autotransporter adhesin